MTGFLWKNTSGGSWNDGTNWDPSGGPVFFQRADYYGNSYATDDSATFATGAALSYAVSGRVPGSISITVSGDQVVFQDFIEISNANGSGLSVTNGGRMTIAADSRISLVGHAGSSTGLFIQSATLVINGTLYASQATIGSGSTLLVAGAGALYEADYSFLSIQAGATIDIRDGGTMRLFNDGPNIANGGVIRVDAGGTLAGTLYAVSGDILLAGGTINAYLGLLSSGTVSGFGTITRPTGGRISDAGAITARGGTLRIEADITGNYNPDPDAAGTLAIASQATLELAGSTAGAIDFLGDNARLMLDPGAVAPGLLRGFSHLDSIDLVGKSVTAVDLVANGGNTMLTAYNGIDIAGRFTLEGHYDQGSIVALSDGNGGTALTELGPHCFGAGTLLLTSRGEVAIEALRIGDEMPTLVGQAPARVVWIGHWHANCATHADPASVQPVRVRQGAFGPGLPRRDLILSPEHAVYVDGALIPIRHLVNGGTVVQESVAEIHYWHVRLDRHDVMLAEGLAAESWRDTTGGAFSDGMLPTCDAPEAACVPVIEAGPLIGHAREMLVGHAAALGILLTPAQSVALRDPGTLQVRLRPGTGRVHLVSPARTPQGDRRRLGAAIAALRLDGVPIDLRGQAIRGGFHGTESAADGGLWRWTDGEGVLAIANGPAGSLLEIDVVAVSAA